MELFKNRCMHLRPLGCPEPNVEKKMSILAKAEKMCDYLWGVVNPGNALVHSIHRTKKQAMKVRKENACAYVVVRVVVTPVYQQDYKE